jgi:transcription elongation factor Elf1
MNTILPKLEAVLGPSKKSSKKERLFHCPICNYHKPKLSVNFGNKPGWWKCWVCGVGGKKLTSLLRKMDIKSGEISYIMEGMENYTPPEHEEIIKVPTLPNEYIPLWEGNPSSYEFKNALSFIKKRGLTRHDIYRYQLGYCETGKYAHSIIVPSFDEHGKLNYFVARKYFDSYIKYMNPDISKNVVVFENLINFDMEVVLCEGIFDAITIRRNAIPLLGKVMSESLKIKLTTQRPPLIYVMLDGDARLDALKIENYIRGLELNVKLVPVEDKDASDMGFDRSWDCINNAKQSSFSEFVSEKLNMV